MAKKKEPFGLKDLAGIIRSRRERPSDGSYTAMLIDKGAGHVCRKLQEEVLEAILESHDGHRDRLVQELGDVLYHALVLGACHNIFLEDIENCLAAHHRSVRTADAQVLKKLETYEAPKPPATTATLLKRSKCKVSGATDVVLFSPNLLSDTPGIHAAKSFPSETKALRTYFQRNDVKVKMGVATDDEIKHAPRRRSTELVLPIICVVNAVLIPLCVSLLAAYLKDIIDKAGKGKKTPVSRQTTKLSICLCEGKRKKTRWFRFEGKLEQVRSELKSVVEDE